MIRFNSPATSGSASGRRRPPPNYFSRRVQMKVMFLVFLFMTVLMLMTESADPDNWRWMWRLGDPAVKQLGPPADTGTPAQDQPALPPPSDPTPNPLVSQAEKPFAPQEMLKGTLDESLRAFQINGWSFVLGRLDRPQRLLLAATLRDVRGNRKLSEGQQSARQDILTGLEEGWNAYHSGTARALESGGDPLTDLQRQHCREIMEASRTAWQQQLTSLRALIEGNERLEQHATPLAGLQQLLDARAFAQVEDNTMFRTSDREAWTRLWEILLSTSPAEKAAAAETPVSFVQLFSQPDAYRGKLVAVRGMARRGYRLPSREAAGNVSGYHVLWIWPPGGDSPLVAYCHKLPDGFPQLSERTATRYGTQLNADVQVTGYFFKRWLYLSGEGLNLAPLLLGEVTDWQPPATSLTGKRDLWLSPAVTTVMIVFAACIGALIAVRVYRASRWSIRAGTAWGDNSGAFAPFDDEQVLGSIGDSLRQLSEEDRQGTGTDEP